jgi:hypothetical protein
MVPVGRLDPFDEQTENIESYLIRLESFMTINDIQEDQKVHALIAVLGSKVFDELCALCAPGTPTTETYEDLKILLTTRYKKSHMANSQRQILSLRKQKHGESVATFMSELRLLVRTCSYTTKERLEEAVLQFF